MPWPSRPVFSVRLPQPLMAPPARRASTQAIAALRTRRGVMRRRSLTPGPGCGPLRVHPETGGLQRLEPRDGGAGERPVGVLLEDQAQPLERRPGPPLQPAAKAELRLEPLARRAHLALDRHVNAGEAAARGLELPEDPAQAAAVAARLGALRDGPRPVGLHDGRLDP